MQHFVVKLFTTWALLTNLVFQLPLTITRIHIYRLTQYNISNSFNTSTLKTPCKLWRCTCACTCMYMYVQDMYMYMFMSCVCKHIISPHSLMGNAIVSDEIMLMSCSANVALGYAHARVHVNNFNTLSCIWTYMYVYKCACTRNVGAIIGSLVIPLWHTCTCAYISMMLLRLKHTKQLTQIDNNTVTCTCMSSLQRHFPWVVKPQCFDWLLWMFACVTRISWWPGTPCWRPSVSSRGHASDASADPTHKSRC